MVSRVTIGLRVMMAETGVVLGSRDSAVTCGWQRCQRSHQGLTANSS